MPTHLAIRCFPAGPFEANCYLLAGEEADSCILIDPGGDPERIRGELDAFGRKLELILLTHSHFDHVGAVGALREIYPEVKVGCHAVCGERIREPRENLSVLVVGHAVRLDAPDRTFADGDEFEAAGVALRALHVPGHAPGHLVYYCAASGILVSGDVLFSGSIGRTDLPGGDTEQLLHCLAALLKDLPGETRVLSGHGPETTVAEERAHNPYLQDLECGGLG